MSEALKKTTVILPEDLLAQAQKVTGENITATIRLGLKLIAASKSFETLRGYKGRYKSCLDLKALREDR
jgi:hypothetical protein